MGAIFVILAIGAGFRGFFRICARDRGNFAYLPGGEKNGGWNGAGSGGKRGDCVSQG